MFENRLRVQERIRDMTELMEEIRKRIVFFDGGTGSLLQANGLKPGELPGDVEYPSSGDCDKAALRLSGRGRHYQDEYFWSQRAEV